MAVIEQMAFKPNQVKTSFPAIKTFKVVAKSIIWGTHIIADISIPSHTAFSQSSPAACANAMHRARGGLFASPIFVPTKADQ